MSTAPPPSPSARTPHPQISPLQAALSLVAVVSLPMLFYTLFILLKCPRNAFRRTTPSTPLAQVSNKVSSKLSEPNNCGVFKYKKSAEVDIVEECPVCLSVFVEGEDVKKLGACGHAFHVACIDTWLCSHASCPVCRAAVAAVKRGKRVVDRGEDFRQGLPDASSLI